MENSKKERILVNPVSFAQSNDRLGLIVAYETNRLYGDAKNVDGDFTQRSFLNTGFRDGYQGKFIRIALTKLKTRDKTLRSRYNQGIRDGKQSKENHEFAICQLLSDNNSCHLKDPELKSILETKIEE
jgi:hypothetical protein